MPEIHTRPSRKFFNEMLKDFWIMPEDVLFKDVQCAAIAAQPLEQVQDRTIEERFREQADKWDRETGHISSPAQRFAHPSYMAILGMANEDKSQVIDLLLRDMQQNRREWFWALSYLTQENPITRKEAGSLDRMIDAWVRWGRERRRRK